MPVTLTVPSAATTFLPAGTVTFTVFDAVPVELPLVARVYPRVADALAMMPDAVTVALKVPVVDSLIVVCRLSVTL